MKTKKDIKSEIVDIYKNFLNAYFIERDLEKSLNFLSPQFIATGTGKDENLVMKDKIEELFKRDFEQAPEPIYYNLYYVNPIMVTENVFIILSEYKLITNIDNKKIELDHLRSTAIFKKEDDGWKLLHSHISFPFVMQKEGEAYPLSAIKERNEILEGITTEKKIDKLILKLEKLATTDNLTGIYNRGKFEKILEYEVSKCTINNSDLSLLMFDIDNFKDINDTYGHLIGDRVLVQFANVIKEVIRKTDIFARWGGDEFVILAQLTDIESAIKLARKIQHRVASYDFGLDRKITISTGVTLCTPGESVISFVQRADNLLYLAKTSGKNNVKVK